MKKLYYYVMHGIIGVVYARVIRTLESPPIPNNEDTVIMPECTIYKEYNSQPIVLLDKPPAYNDKISTYIEAITYVIRQMPNQNIGITSSRYKY